MTQPYDERPVAPTSTPDGPDGDAPAQTPGQAAPPQDTAADEAAVAEAPADNPVGAEADVAEADVAVADVAVAEAAEPEAAEPGAADSDTLSAEEDAPQDPAGGAPTDAAAPTDDGFGDPRVDDAVARLQELADRPVGEHAEVFDDIHQRLRDALEEAAVEPADEPRG